MLEQAAEPLAALDPLGRTADIVHKNAAGVTVGGASYAFDAGDRITSQTINGVTQTFGYDKLSQLTNNDGTGITYDASGNRTADGSGTVTVDTGNRVTGDGVWTYAYNDLGQVTGKSKSGEAWAYTYDLNGQMTAASKSATVGGAVTDSVAYAYDAWGNQVSRVQTGTTSSTERYVVDGWDTAKPGARGTENFDVTLDLNSSNAVTARRVFGGGFDAAVARRDASGVVSWYGADALGSVRQVFDNSGAEIGSRTFDGFGNVTASSGTGLDRYGFTGTVTDPLTGLVGDNARVYDPTSGRWLSQDPIGFNAGDANLYRYVGNNATTGRDPSGMQPLPVQMNDWLKEGFLDVDNTRSRRFPISVGGGLRDIVVRRGASAYDIMTLALQGTVELVKVGNQVSVKRKALPRAQQPAAPADLMRMIPDIERRKLLSPEELRKIESEQAAEAERIRFQSLLADMASGKVTNDEIKQLNADAGPNITAWYAKDLHEHLALRLKQRQWTEDECWNPQVAIANGLGELGILYTTDTSYYTQAKYLLSHKWMDFGGPKGLGKDTVVLGDPGRGGIIIRKNALGNIGLGVISRIRGVTRAMGDQTAISIAYGLKGVTTYDKSHPHAEAFGKFKGLDRADNLAAFGVGAAIADRLKQLDSYKAGKVPTADEIEQAILAVLKPNAVNNAVNIYAANFRNGGYTIGRYAISFVVYNGGFNTQGLSTVNSKVYSVENKSSINYFLSLRSRYHDFNKANADCKINIDDWLQVYIEDPR